MNILFNDEYFEKYLRFEYDTKDKILPLLKNNEKEDVRKILRMLYSVRKKPIPDSVINLFYTDPTRFFREYHKLLDNCCFLDSLGIPILVHYFNVLNEEYRQRNNKQITLQNCNFEIYKSNFETFIKDNEKFLLIHDFSLDTPLHKLVKKPDKGLFIEIYEKLKRLNLINNEILLVTNVDGESIYNYIFKEIKYNYPKIKDNDFYYKFINDNNSINESLSQEDQNLIKEYKSKVIFNNIKYDKNNFDNVFNNFTYYVNKNDNIFAYIYHHFNSDINYLNCLYAICSQNEHYDKMYKLVSKLSTKNEMQNKFCISELCLIDHIRYVLSKLNFDGKNVENEMNYVKKLIKEILKNILNNKNNDEKSKILDSELRDLKGHETFKNGLINILVRNPYLDFEKKIELFDLFHEITNGLSDQYIEKNASNFYKILKVLERVQPTDKNVFDLYNKYDSLKDLIDNNVFYRRLIKDDILGRILDKKYSSFNEIIEDRVAFLMEFLKKNNYNKFKNKYNVTEPQSKKLFRLLIIFEQAIYNLKGKYKNEDDLFNYLENNGITCNYEIPSEELNIFKRMQKMFVGSDKTMTEALLDYYLKLFKKSAEFMEPFMDIALCPYHDLSGYIFNYQNVYCVVEDLFVKYYGKYNYNKDIADHESNKSDGNKEKEENEEKETLKLKVFQKNLPALKGLPFANTYYAFLMMISSTVGKIELLLSEEKQSPFFKKYLESINNIYFPKMFYSFGEPFDYTEIIGILNQYTLPLSKIFIKYINTFKGIMNEFVPNLDIEPYLKAMKYVRDETEHHVKNNNYKENELPKDIVNNFICLMVIIYISKKYDKDYPNLSNFICFHLISKDSSEIINAAEECFAKNNFQDIFNKIIFEEPLNSNVKYKILDYYTQNYNSFHDYFTKIKKIKNRKYISFLKGFAYIDNLEVTYPKYKYERFLPYYEEKRSIRNLLYLDFSNVPNISEITEFSGCGVHESVNNEEHEDEDNDEEYNYHKKDKKETKKEVLTDINGYKYVFQNYFGKPDFLKFFSLLDEPCDKMNKYMIKKIISIIDKLSLVCNTVNVEDYISDEKEIRDLYNRKLYGKQDIFFNMHQLFLCIKEEKKTLFNILNNSQLFIILFYNYLYCVYYNSQIGKILGKEKTNYIKNEIYEFVKACDATNNKNLFFNFIIKNDSDATTYITNEIKQFKDRNVYDKLKNNLDTLKYETFLRLSTNFEKIFKYFIDNKNKELLIDFLNFCSKCQTKFKDDQCIKSANVLGYALSIIFKIMEKNIETFVNYLPDIKPIFESYEKGNELIKKYLIKNIFKSNKFDLLNNNFVQYQMNISFNFDSYLLYLNKTTNNGENKYIYNKLKELNSDENSIFIKFLENKIMNEYVFDNLIKVVSKKQNKSFFDNNKVFIIKSLYIYSQINGFYYIDKLLKYIKSFTSEEEVKRIIYPSEDNDQYPHILNNYFKIKSTTDKDYGEQEGEEGEEGNESYHNNNNRNNNNEDDSDLIIINNEIEKNLLYYSIYQRGILNYETIAVLLNYCPKETAILNIFPTFYNRNKVFDFHIINYVDYFSKHKDSIKSCNKFFYNFTLFLESLSNPKNHYELLMSFENNIFFLYLQIIILEITPAQLFSKRFYSRDNEQLNKTIDKILYIIKKTEGNCKISKDCSELELFAIFALYEIKGIPLIPIKKYIPEFYAKIENYVKKFKSFKISDVCLKSSFDVKFYEYFMNNIKNNTLQVITDFKNYYNAIFILEKEYSNITNIQNKKEIYLQKAIYNLIFNGGISPFYDNETKTDEFLSILKRNEVSDDYNCQMNSSCFIKECIFSLKNFNRSSSSIIQKLLSNDYDSKGWICYYIKYLQIIKNICGYIMCYLPNTTDNKNKKNNDFTINKYDIFSLRDILFKDNNNIFDSLKNSIDVNQIKYYIIEGLKKDNINKNENIFYDMTINWLDKYLQQKDITMKITELSKMSFFNYFNYVYLYCEILISWLNKVEDMLAYKKDKNEDEDFKLDIKIFENSDKNVSNKNYGDSLLILGRQCMNVYKSDNNNINTTLSIFYYFDENLGDYVETSNGFNFYYFSSNKLYLIKNFLKEIKKYDNEEIKLITEKIDKRDNSFFQYLIDRNLYFEQNKELFKNYTPLTDKLLEKNQNFIGIYLENTAGNVNQPKYYDCVEDIKYQFNNYLNSFIYPALLFNFEIGAFCENRFLSFDLLKYKNYVNFYEMINSILNSNYHKDNNLNELFKARAIYYILNNDSLIHIYIDEIYKLKRDNMNSKIDYFKERNKPLTDTFIIKIDEKGKKYGKSDFNKLKDALENNNNDLDYSKLISSKPIKNQNKGTKKQKIKYKLKTNDTQTKSKLYFASYVNNPYRKENVPILGYTGFIPNEKFDFGLTKSKQFEKVFSNKFYKKEKNNIKIFESLIARDEERNNNKNKRGKKKVINNDKFVNVFDLMFTVKSVNRNVIELYKNDISGVLSQYSEPKVFNDLLNHPFPKKEVKDVNINWDLITKYVNENP